MRSCGHGLLLVLASLATAPAPAGPPSLKACLELEAVPARTECAESFLADRPELERLGLLTPFVEDRPETVVALLERMGKASADRLASDPALEAMRLDLMGQSLTRLGQAADAAAALSAAVALDDGTLRLQWKERGGGATWSRSVDLGNRRLVRAAEALVAAGRHDDARPLLQRASALGGDPTAGNADANAASAPVPLSGPVWREPLPDLEVQLYGGRKRALRDARGSVLLLDFWASWCEPCVRELPFIQELYESRGPRGLEVLAINYHEEPQEALAFAQAMGLSVPVGAADRAIEKAFDIRSMPTVILADRSGRIRGRWAGYEDNVEGELTSLIDELLAAPEDPGLELGRVLEGAGALSVDWVRVARREIESVQIVRADTGPRLAVAHARALSLFDQEGREDRVLTRPRAASVLRVADLDADDRDELIAFRPGASGVFVFNLTDKTFTQWESPHPVFDVDVVPVGAEGRPSILLGTIDGLWRVEPDGSDPSRVAALGAVSGVRRASDGGTRLTVLESGARLHWLDRDLVMIGSAPVAPTAWTLVAAPAVPGAAAGPADLIASAAGRFLRGGGQQIALALRSGQLVLIDARTGETRFRAVLDGPIDSVAGGDLDGDGLDELVVVQGHRLVLLRAAAPSGNGSGARRAP